MAIENAVYVSQLDKNLPDGDVDTKDEGDDILRMLKAVLLNTFPNANGAIAASAAELSALAGALGSGAQIRVPTQTAGDASTKAASTAFVMQALAAAVVGMPPYGASVEQYTLQINGGTPSWGLGSPLTMLSMMNQGVI